MRKSIPCLDLFCGAGIVLVGVGAFAGNKMILASGCVVFASFLAYMFKLLCSPDPQDEAKAYAIKSEADRKMYETKTRLDAEIGLLQQAYHDGKISDEDISYLVKGLAGRAVNTNYVEVESKPRVVRPMTTANPAIVKPMVQEEVKDDTKESVETVVEEVVTVADEEVVVEEVVETTKAKIDGTYVLENMHGPMASIIVGGEEVAINIREFNKDMSSVPHKDCDSLTAWCKKTVLDIDCMLYLNIVERTIELRAL